MWSYLEGKPFRQSTKSVDAIEARENIDINGGDDVDDDISLEPCPTWRDVQVLKAVSTICRYTEDINEPIARKVEAILGSFNSQIRLESRRESRDQGHENYYFNWLFPEGVDFIFWISQIHSPRIFSDFFWIFLRFFESIFSIPQQTHNPW